MREFCLNFEERKIERDYELTECIAMIDYDKLLSLPIEIFNKKYERLITRAINTDAKAICLYINLVDRQSINENDAMYLLGTAANLTLTQESTNRNYMYIPPWFHDRVHCSVMTQNKLGNYVNKFKHLQIIICTCNKETGEFEAVERLVN